AIASGCWSNPRVASTCRPICGNGSPPRPGARARSGSTSTSTRRVFFKPEDVARIALSSIPTAAMCLLLEGHTPLPPSDAAGRHRETTNTWGGNHATHRIWGRAGRNACGQQHRPGPSSELDAAARKPALPVEMGRGRRARLRQPHEAADGAQRSQADQDRRSHRTRIRAQCEYAVLRHTALRRARQTHLHERVRQSARQQRGDRHFRDRAGRHSVRRFCPPDPRKQLVQLLQGRRERNPFGVYEAGGSQRRRADHARRADRRRRLQGRRDARRHLRDRGQDLEGALKKQNITLQPGDAVIINTGWGKLWGKDNACYVKSCPGIGVKAAEWLIAKDPMLLGSDNWPVEVAPNPDPKISLPVHQIALVVNGVHLLENLKLDELAGKGV